MSSGPNFPLIVNLFSLYSIRSPTGCKRWCGLFHDTPAFLNNFTTTRSDINTLSPRMAGNENLPSGIPAMTKTAAAPQCSKGDDTADFGDFVRNEDEELDLEEVVEPWYNYDIKETSHVFYPICLAEVLNGRYLVENKMGSGGGSTVWMAHDLQETRDVALKVMASRE